MFAVSSRLRVFAVLTALTVVSQFTDCSLAQTIDLSLNVFYTTPSNVNSGGTWELVAKASNTTFGISALVAKIRNINNDSVLEGPRATVNGNVAAGFQSLANIAHPADGADPAYLELVVGQVPLLPLPSGSEENLFYGVGTLNNGAPNYPGKGTANFIGPAFTSLTNPQDIPWAVADTFGDAAWNTAARLLSGTFATGATPSFFTGSTGQVFTSLPPTNTTIGNTALAAAITTIVRTNFVVANSADYNHDGIVDPADYVLWRKTLGPIAPPGSGADGNADGVVDNLDYDLWRSHFGNPMGSGAGVGVSANVPEPASFALLTMATLVTLAPRRGRFQYSVNK